MSVTFPTPNLFPATRKGSPLLRYYLRLERLSQISMRGRRRRGRARFRRQSAGIVFQPGGGLLLDSGGDSEGSTAGQQQSENRISENQNTFTGHVQTHLHPSANVNLRPSSSEGSDAPATSTFLLAPTSAVDVVPIMTTPFSSSSVQSSSPTSLLVSPSKQLNSSSSMVSTSSFSGLPSSGTIAAAQSASRSSGSASSAPSVATAGHSAEFYGGIVFVAVVALACLFSFAAWLLRSHHRNRSMCCCGGKENEDIEHQDLGFGLGLYLDKPANAFPSPSLSSTPLPGPARSTSQPNPYVFPAFQGVAQSPGRYPMTATRPATAHLLTSDTVQPPSRLLGPLQVKNYVSGDFPSSCDEGMLSPKLGSELRNLREPQSSVTPRSPGFGGHGFGVPWAPLNIKSARGPSQVSVAHAALKTSEEAQADGEEEIRHLPTPAFDFSLTQKDSGVNSPDRWGASLRSNIYSTLSGLAGGTAKLEELTTLPASDSRSSRWRNALSSSKSGGAGVEAAESRSDTVCDTKMSPKATPVELSPTKHGPSLRGLNVVGLGMKLDGKGIGAHTDTTAPLALYKKRTINTRAKLRSDSVASTSTSYVSSIYSPCPDTTRYSSRCAPKGSKRGSVRPQSSLITRTRPEFLRQQTVASTTSFSSEASETSREMTDDELRAKRMMMLRARRKRGMGMNGSARRRVTRSNALGRQSSRLVSPSQVV